MRLLPALAFLAALAASGAAAAQSADKPLTSTGVSALIKDQKAWCSAWQAADQSCEELVFLDADKGKVTQTRRYRMSDTGDIEMIVRQQLALEGDGLCWTFKFLDLDIVILNEGRRAPAEQAAAMILLIRERMTDLEGKRTCERFTRDRATGDILSTTTVDGAPAPEFDSRFRLLPPETRIKLRPLIEFGEEPTTT